jgi:hypothetical protein
MKTSRYTSLALLRADQKMQEEAAKAALAKANGYLQVVSPNFVPTPAVIIIEPSLIEIKEQEVFDLMAPPQPVDESESLPDVSVVVPVIEPAVVEEAEPVMPAYFAASAPAVAVVEPSEDDDDTDILSDEDLPVFSRSSLDDEDAVRAIAREVGLSGWWNKKLDRLLEELSKSGHIALKE